MAGVEPFYERFGRVLEASGLSDTEVAAVMGVSAAQVSRIKKGVAESIRFADGLRLCAKLGIDPWELAFGRPRQPAFSAYPGSESPPQDDERLAKVESDLREMRAIVERLEAAFPAPAAASKARRKGRRTA